MKEKEEYMEVGKITNVQGLMGEVRAEVWADSPDFLKEFSTLYVGNGYIPMTVERSRTHKKMGIIKFEGLTDVNSAMVVRGQKIYFKREQVTLPEGHFFIADLIGVDALDATTGAFLGKIDEVLPLPAHNVYAIRGGERDILVPAVDAFIKETNISEGFVKVNMMEGL